MCLPKGKNIADIHMMWIYMYPTPNRFECENCCIGVCIDIGTWTKNQNPNVDISEKFHLGHIAEGSARVLNGQKGSPPEERDFITHIGILPRHQSQEWAVDH